MYIFGGLTPKNWWNIWEHTRYPIYVEVELWVVSYILTYLVINLEGFSNPSFITSNATMACFPTICSQMFHQFLGVSPPNMHILSSNYTRAQFLSKLQFVAPVWKGGGTPSIHRLQHFLWGVFFTLMSFMQCAMQCVIFDLNIILQREKQYWINTSVEVR